MLVIRKLLPQESGRLKEHLLRLDAEDRRLRFGHVVTPEVILAYVDALQGQQAWVVGAFEDETLRGVAELRDMGAREGKAGELSVTVERGWQDQGIGTRLLEEALLIARNRGFTTLYLLCLPDNAKMQHLARKFTDRISLTDGDVEVHIRNPLPDALSVFAEFLGDGLALWQTALARVLPRDETAPPPKQPSLP